MHTATPARLHRICLMVPQLQPVVEQLQRLFGLTVVRRDPRAALWGIEHAVLPLGTGAIEVCAPIRQSAAAHRFLATRPHGGGFGVALGGVHLGRCRAHLQRLDLRVVADVDEADGGFLQVHPRDCGNCLLQFDGGADGTGMGGTSGALSAIELRSRAPLRLAAHWSAVLRSPLARAPSGLACLPLDGGAIRFTLAGDAEREGLAAVELRVADVDRVLHAAAACGVAAGPTPATLALAGVVLRLVDGEGSSSEVSGSPW